MTQNELEDLKYQLAQYQEKRNSYKKQLWLKSKELTPEKKKTIKKLFMKIDRIRNNMKFVLKHLSRKKVAERTDQSLILLRSKKELEKTFKLLDHTLYDPVVA